MKTANEIIKEQQKEIEELKEKLKLKEIVVHKSPDNPKNKDFKSGYVQTINDVNPKYLKEDLEKALTKKTWDITTSTYTLMTSSFKYIEKNNLDFYDFYKKRLKSVSHVNIRSYLINHLKNMGYNDLAHQMLKKEISYILKKDLALFITVSVFNHLLASMILSLPILKPLSETDFFNSPMSNFHYTLIITYILFFLYRTAKLKIFEHKFIAKENKKLIK